MLHAEGDMQFSRFYVFMYPWAEWMTDYLSATTDGDRVGGAFDCKNGFKVQRACQWVSLYDRAGGVGVVMRYTHMPPDVDYATLLWDRTTPYKKHYAMLWQNSDVAEGSTFTFAVRIGFFDAGVEAWQDRAAEIAASLVS